MKKNKGVTLQNLYADEVIKLSATEYGGTFARSTSIYPGGLDLDFENWGLVSDKPSPEMEVQMKEVSKGDGTLAEIFAAIGDDLESLRVPQAQAKNFGVEHPEKLHPKERATFIVFTKDDEPVNLDRSNLFVAAVGTCYGKLYARARKFLDDFVWPADHKLRIVFQKQW